MGCLQAETSQQQVEKAVVSPSVPATSPQPAPGSSPGTQDQPQPSTSQTHQETKVAETVSTCNALFELHTFYSYIWGFHKVFK